MDIVVTGYAGYDGSVIIYHDEKARNELLGRYPKSFFGVFEDTGLPQVDFEEQNGTGGVLAALWHLLKERKLGAEFSLRAFPIRQQTVELCEFFGLDPYRLYAPSVTFALAETTGELEEIRKKAQAQGLPCRVIGHTRKGPGIKRTDNEQTAYLRRPEEDELERFFRNRQVQNRMNQAPDGQIHG